MDTFNIFMQVTFEPDGRHTYGVPVIEKGNFIDFRAHMDLRVTISACRADNEVDGDVCKPLGIELWEAEGVKPSA